MTPFTWSLRSRKEDRKLTVQEGKDRDGLGSRAGILGVGPEDSWESWPVGRERGLDRRPEATGQVAGRGRMARGLCSFWEASPENVLGLGPLRAITGPSGPQLPHLGNGKMNAPPKAHSRVSQHRLCAPHLAPGSKGRGWGKAGSGLGGCCMGGFGAFYKISV